MSAYTGVLRSEWTKLRSVRSTYVTLGVGVLLSILFGALAAKSAAHEWPTMSPAERAGFDPLIVSLDGAAWAELAFGVLGVLAVSSEYGTGAIRTTLMAVPQRRVVLAAKMAVMGGLAFVMGELVAFGSFLVGQCLLSEAGIGVSLLAPHVLQSLWAAGVYLLVLTLVGMSLGSLIRHTAGAVAALFTLLYLAYGLARGLQAWSHVPDRWLLVNIGDSLARLSPTHEAKVPSSGGAWAELVVYAVVAVSLAMWRFSQDP